MEIAESLRKETEKWLIKLENLKIEAKSERGSEYKKNIEAYINDSKHFTENGDLIRAFEAIVWAWAFFEISEELGLLERK